MAFIETAFFLSIIDDYGRFVSEQKIQNKTILIAKEEKVQTPYISTGSISVGKPSFVFSVIKGVNYGGDLFFIKTSSDKLISTTLDDTKPAIELIDDDCSFVEEQKEHCEAALWNLEKSGMYEKKIL